MAKMHHIWLPTDKYEETTAFYENVVGVTGGDVDMGLLPGQSQQTQATRRITDGQVEIHIGPADHSYLFNSGYHVPSFNHHHAFSVDDIEEAKHRLRKHGVPFDDLGEGFIRGRYQLFFYDPAGNIVEITQTDAS